MDTNQDTDSDRELLRRFADRGEESAFRGLVDRHAAMVRGVALRCTGDAALSDEVAQSVFFLLARRAVSVPADHLGGWLHRAAFLTARNVRRKSLRYQQALRELGRDPELMSNTPEPDSQGSPWEDIRPYLDEAVARLPERARQPVMLRFFESRSIREIASLTGSSEAAVRKVLERSLQRLSGLLRRRGIVTNGAALGVMLSAQSLVAPPASAAVLASGALSASAMVAAAAAGPLAGPLHFLFSSQRLKTAGLAVLLASAPVAWLWNGNRSLRKDLEASRQSPPAASASLLTNPMAFTPRPASAGGAAVDNVQPPEKPDAPAAANTADQLKEKRAREAAGELARISLYLPGLTEEQRAGILKLYGDRSLRRAQAFDQARQSGVFARLSAGTGNLSPEDKTLLRTMNSAPSELVRDGESLKSILTAEQYARHQETVERRRVNDAEGVAADSLRALGRSFDLSPEQKDAVFQAVAQFELAPSSDPDGQPVLPFGPGSCEEQRADVIRERLSPEQAVLFDQKREEDRQHREQFLQRMGGFQPSTDQPPAR